jgi:hypothetical protein
MNLAYRAQSYQTHVTARGTNQQLLIGLKKHLMIAQDTTAKKDVRLTSLNNMSEVLEYVLSNINEAVSAEEQAVLRRFFNLLLTKIRKSVVAIHSRPENFQEELSFINILLKM